MALNFPKGFDESWEEDYDTWTDVEKQCDQLTERVLNLRGTWIGDAVDYAPFNTGLLFATTLLKVAELIKGSNPSGAGFLKGEAQKILKGLHEIGDCCNSSWEEKVYQLAGVKLEPYQGEEEEPDEED